MTGRPDARIAIAPVIGPSMWGCHPQTVIGVTTGKPHRSARDGLRFIGRTARTSAVGWTALVTGQLPIPTGPSRTGMSRATRGLPVEDQPVTERSKPRGCFRDPARELPGRTGRDWR
jgi:hypothetical protein